MRNDDNRIDPAVGTSPLSRASLARHPGLQLAVQPTDPQTAGQAVDLMLAGLRWLARADLASVPVAAQANVLREP